MLVSERKGEYGIYRKTEAKRRTYSVTRVDVADIYASNRLIYIFGYLINIVGLA